MLRHRISLVVCSLALLTAFCVLTMGHSALAQQWHVETIDEPAPSDAIDPSIAKHLSQTGYRVARGTRTVWEFWPCKQWEAQADFKPTSERLYPLQPGHLFGVVRLPRRWSDFRQQPISRGVYTLRFALQPVDGNHEGTSPTRDFLLLLPAESDTSPDPVELDALYERSAEAGGATHPALVCMQPGGASGGTPQMVYDEARDWWIFRFVGRQNVGTEQGPLVVSLVVQGQADE